jgi:aspartyl-tRNA(Asn)/glutamyl-tRNA(Gln) amidotransferase subunit B
MRTKEDAHDYRYFPDPDLPPLVIAPEWIERVRGRHARVAARDGRAFREKDYGLPAYDATMMTQSKAFVPSSKPQRKPASNPSWCRTG